MYVAEDAVQHLHLAALLADIDEGEPVRLTWGGEPAGPSRGGHASAVQGRLGATTCRHQPDTCRWRVHAWCVGACLHALYQL